MDITAHAKKIVFSGWFEAGAEVALTDDGLRVIRPGKFTKMVDAVEHVTFSGRRVVPMTVQPCGKRRSVRACAE